MATFQGFLLVQISHFISFVLQKFTFSPLSSIIFFHFSNSARYLVKCFLKLNECHPKSFFLHYSLFLQLYYYENVVPLPKKKPNCMFIIYTFSLTCTSTILSNIFNTCSKCKCLVTSHIPKHLPCPCTYWLANSYSSLPES